MSLPESSSERRPAVRPAESPHELRVSDAERNLVADLLRDAAGDGRLTLEELDERLESVYRAKTYGELVPVTADLPGARDRMPVAPPVSGSAQPAASARSSAAKVVPSTASASSGAVAIMSGAERAGVWTVSPAFTALAVMGGIELDFRQAVFTAQETVVYANTLMGGIDVTVPPDVRVRVTGVGIMGGFDGPKNEVTEDELPPDAPTLVIKGIALMGGVGVQVKPRKDPDKRKSKKSKGSDRP